MTKNGSDRVLRNDERVLGFGGDSEVEKENRLAHVGAALAERIAKEGKYFSILHPEDSFLWDFPAYKRLRKLPGVMLVASSQCTCV